MVVPRHRAAVLHVEDAETRARGVQADGHRREGGVGVRERAARRGYEEAVDEDLGLVVVRVEDRGLVQEEGVLAVRVPAYW